MTNVPPGASMISCAFPADAGLEEMNAFFRRFIPYLNGRRDVTEPETLYLWDAAARAGLTYRNYGEFVGTFSEADLRMLRTNKDKTYPDPMDEP